MDHLTTVTASAVFDKAEAAEFFVSCGPLDRPTLVAALRSLDAIGPVSYVLGDTPLPEHGKADGTVRFVIAATANDEHFPLVSSDGQTTTAASLADFVEESPYEIAWSMS